VRRLKLHSASGEAAKNQLEIDVAGGYRWFPFDRRLCVAGWLKVACR
jgi:hypothetical protein